MRQYSVDVEKYYNLIDAIAKKGVDEIYNYTKFLDEMVNNGNYGIMVDVFYQYYGLRVRDYSFDEFKTISYKYVSEQTSTYFQKNLKTYMDKKNIYAIGQNYFRNYTYLGDIIGYDGTLEVYTGLSSSIYHVIPPFTNSIIFPTGSQVVYDYSVYQCVNAYTSSYITPTYSYYFATYSYTYSYNVITQSSDKLSMYKTAINLFG